MISKPKLVLLVIILLRCHLFSFAQQSEFLWAKKLGGPSGFNCAGRSIVEDNSGNIYLAGYFYNTVDFDPGPGIANITADGPSGYLAKYDSSGNYQWAFKMGQYAFTVLLDDSMNVFVGGTFYGNTDFDPGPDTAFMNSIPYINVYLAKYTSDGNYIWARSISGNTDEYLGNKKIISLDKYGNIFVSGFFEDTVYFNLPDSIYLTSKGWLDAFIAKYDTSGNFIWAKSIVGQDSSVAQIRAMLTDDSGNYYITGCIHSGIFDFDPGPDTAYLVNTGNYNDAFLAKFDADGNYMWAFAIDASVQIDCNTIAIDNNNNICIAGSIGGEADFDPDSGTAMLLNTNFFVKYNNAGNYLLAKRIGSSGIYNISIDSSGNIAVAGYFTDSTADFDPGPDIVNLKCTINEYNAFWAVYDSSGNYVLAQSMYGTSECVAYALAFNENTILVTGKFEETIFFDSTETEYLVAVGIVPYADNAFFAKYLLDFSSSAENINNYSADLIVYPNPGNGLFTMRFINSSYFKDGKIAVHNILGDVVFNANIPNRTENGSPRFIINISSQPDGIYFYRFTVGDGKPVSGKLIKE